MEKYKEILENLAKDIWDFAEIKFHEEKSARAQIEILKSFGFTVKENLAGIPTAFSAEFGEGTTIGFLGEFDALSGLSQVEDLPVREEKIKGACGHGCGHHLLGAASVGAALELKDYIEENNLNARVIYFGCPGEEGGSGKAFMAKAGVFDDVDIAISWHPFNGNGIIAGSMLANKQVYVEFKGKSSHAAGAPHLGRSALDALEITNIGVNFLREHMQDVERIHYSIIDAGSTSPNVVQNYAKGLYLIRSKNTPMVDALYERFEKIVEGAGLITETQGNIIFDKACSNIVPNSVVEEVLYESFNELGPVQYTDAEREYAQQFRDTLSEDAVKSDLILSLVPDKESEMQYLLDNVLYEKIAPYKFLNSISMGSSDVGDVSNVVPTSQIAVACYAVGTVGHSWQEVAQGKSSIAMKGMIKAAEVMSLAGRKFIENPSLIEKAKTEFLQRRGPNFISPIPDGAKPNI